MATWVVGDVQGCFDSFEAWMRRVDFQEDRDRLWLVGDLVNRGPKSLEMLRWAYDHRDIIDVVLGNHDLHLLCCYLGISEPGPRDTVFRILDAEDCDILLGWLRQRPLMFEDDNDVLVHAGIHPSWSLDDARDRARELETVLRSDDYEGFLERWRTDAPPANTEEVRMHDSLDVFTRMRVINRQTSDLDFRFKGALGEVPGDLEPWFRRRNHMTETHRIFFGHWAALGYHEENNTVATDSGCVWGRYLTGFRRSDGVVVSQPAIDKLPRQSF